MIIRTRDSSLNAEDLLLTKVTAFGEKKAYNSFSLFIYIYKHVLSLVMFTN